MIKKILMATAAAVALVPPSAAAQSIAETSTYQWVGDSVLQGPYKAFAPTDEMIISDYGAQPGYFMPVEKVWKLTNDVSSYPRLSGSNRLLQAVYNMGLDEMVNAVEPDTTLRTGKEWAGVWTRDVSYSILLSMAYMQTEAAKTSLRRKVDSLGRIIQDTGSGGAWPVSTDRLVWALAAYEIYKVTGDKAWLREIYPVIKKSVDDDALTALSPDGLILGETSFIDWREQSYPSWMQTADIYNSEAMNTNVVHAAALQILADIATDLGKKNEAVTYSRRAESLRRKIDEKFWMPEKGYYGMYTYGRLNSILNPRAETLGNSLAILTGLAPASRAAEISSSLPVTPFGAPIFFPGIKDQPAYHNNALWPFVASFWALANARAGNDEGTLQAISSVIRPAALFATNKENLRLDNGDIATELNSSNMLWSLSGNLAIVTRILFGIQFEKEGLRFAPFIPKALADTRTLTGFPYRGSRLDITVSGYGSRIKELILNGKKVADPEAVIPASKLKGDVKIIITMADNEPVLGTVNAVANAFAPLTPIARLLHNPDFGPDAPFENELCWNPIEYIAGYEVLRDGKPVGITRSTSWSATEPGEWQVVGIDAAGTRSFSSEPVTNLPRLTFEIPGENTTISSAEISYPPQDAPAGFHGTGFVEIDKTSPPVEITVTVPENGLYALSLTYANGNGPVNTENKAAIRSLIVDGRKAGTLVMPHRGVGNWYDWGETNSVKVLLEAGPHTIRIEYRPEDTNMNIVTNHALLDRLTLLPLNK